MKAKNLEKELDRKIKTCMKEFTNLVTLYEAYSENASEKRQRKFSKKMEKKYGNFIEDLDERIDKLPD